MDADSSMRSGGPPERAGRRADGSDGRGESTEAHGEEAETRTEQPPGEARPAGVADRIDETPEPINQDARPDRAGNTPLPDPDVDAGAVLGSVRTEPDVPPRGRPG